MTICSTCRTPRAAAGVPCVRCGAIDPVAPEPAPAFAAVPDALPEGFPLATAGPTDAWRPTPSTREQRLERLLLALIRASHRLVEEALDLDDGDTVVKTAHLDTLLGFVRRDAEELQSGAAGRVL